MKRKFALLATCLCVLTVLFLRLDCTSLKCYATENGVDGISPSEGVNDFYSDFGNNTGITPEDGTADENATGDSLPNDNPDTSDNSQSYSRSTQNNDQAEASSDNGIGWGMAIVYIIIAAAVVLLIIALLPKKPV